MSSPALLDHYRSRTCSRQWRGFLLAMADEFVEALPEAELSRLMARMGERFASAHPLPRVDDLAGLEQACNQVWADLDWGVARMLEQPLQVEIEHLGAPLGAVLGTQAGWSAGFLEGVYRGWFRAAGMLPALDVQHRSASPDVNRFVLVRVS